MKKIINIFMAVVLIIPCIIIPETARALTLGDLKKELADLEEQFRQNEKDKKMTEAQIDATYNNINSVRNKITQTRENIIKLTVEIEKLNESIKEKDEEIKKIMNFVQTSNGESAYLEYTFGAKDFTDFIYRIAVSEQLAKYNKSLIETYNQMVIDNNRKKEELATKEKQLEKEQKELESYLVTLRTRLKSESDIKLSLEDEIQLLRDRIKDLINKGCKDSDNINSCSRPQLPAGTELFRPLNSGRMTSEFGSRCYKDSKGRWVCDDHLGIDMTQSGSSVPVYSAGTGYVSDIWYRYKCGGNMVFVYHKVNGKNYTIVYAHLRTINVSKGDYVTRNTVIGTMGGNPATEYWDECSSGQHLHFQIATGLYGEDYLSWATFESRCFNPRDIVNFPKLGEYFDDRLTKY